MLIKIFLALVSIIFSLLMIYITAINYKKNILSKIEFLIWNIIWLGIIFLSIRPSFVDLYFDKNFNIDIFYIITIVSIVSLLIFNYFNMLKIKIMEKKINTVIRADSLKNVIEKIKD